MERASNSKKAMKIETALLNKIAMMGQGKFAAQMG
ncbi:CII family transcriptional regulator, partial [Yersinia entomophaga]